MHNKLKNIIRERYKYYIVAYIIFSGIALISDYINTKILSFKIYNFLNYTIITMSIVIGNTFYYSKDGDGFLRVQWKILKQIIVVVLILIILGMIISYKFNENELLNKFLLGKYSVN